MLVIHKVHLVIIMAKVITPKNKLNMYEVGDIVLNMSGVNPGTRFGGTWELTSKGKAIIGVDPDDQDYEQAGLTMGEKKHTLTVDEMPAHSHMNLYTYNNSIIGTGNTPNTGVGTGIIHNGNYNQGSVHTGSAGSGQPHNNIPPSMTLYVWLRTA